MLTSWQVPRAALAWLLLAQLLVILPILKYLPIWLLPVYVVCVVWRIQIFRGAFNRPGYIQKILVVAVGFGTVFFSFGTLVGLEATTSLLLVAFSLKLIESYSRRDCLLLCFLCLLLIAVAFLYNQALLFSLYLLLCFPVVIAALQSLHFSSERLFTLGDMKKSLIIFSQAVPLAVALFLVFPRFEPFWQITLPNQQAKVGVGDSLSPGDITQLTKDSSLAFRATFDGALPDKSQMYWRGVVLSKFDGRAWSSDKLLFLSSKYRPENIPSSDGVDYRYTIIQEPSHRPMLFSLALAASDSYGVKHSNDYLLNFHHNVFERMSYQVVSDVDATRSPDLSSRLRNKELHLGGDSNPRARQFAQSEYAKSDNNEAYIQRILAHFSDADFYYSLDVPQLGANNVDEFLFSSRIGYCGHYASSFAFLMRAAGIPARVVGGYMGGEINPLNSTVMVYQYDAHAWVEVWLQDKGWIRIDPTLQVAPDRVLNTVQDLPETAQQFNEQLGFSAVRFKHIAWVNYLRLQFDVLDYRWANMVLQYKGEKQLDFLHQLLGGVSTGRIFSFLFFVLLPVVLWVMFSYIRTIGSSILTVDEKAYQKLCKLMAGLGVERQSHEGPIDFIRRINNGEYGFSEAINRHLQTSTRLFVALRYERMSSQQRRLMERQLANEVRSLSKLVLKKRWS